MHRYTTFAALIIGIVTWGTGCPESPSISDFDGDGYPDQGDCVPDDASIHPGADEICDDGVDNDCDGFADNDDTDCDHDGDGDGFTVHNDCDDADPNTYPGADETCDGVDNDCDGTVDEGTSCYDDDGDGFTEDEGDCDDDDPAITPVDGDGDGYSVCDGDCDDGDAALNLTDADGDGFSTCDGDCDDGDARINPWIPELDDNVDNDCDGVVDDDAATCDGIVSTGYHAITNAIAAVVGNSSTVLCVEAGVYEETVDYQGKEIRLIGVEGPFRTTIDGLSGGTVVSMDAVPLGASLEGFTITGGLGAPGTGSGVDIRAASPTLEKLIVLENVSYDSGAITIQGDSEALLQQLQVLRNDSADLGAGILIIGSADTVTLRDVWLEQNVAGYAGGGFMILESSASLIDVRLRENLATASGGGGAITESTVSIDGMVAQDNIAESGGGLSISDSTVSMTDVAFIDNEATGTSLKTGNGGGFTSYTTDLSLSRASFIGNVSGSVGGGATFVYDGGGLDLSNVIVAGNEAALGGAGLFFYGAPGQLSSVTVAGNASQAEGGGVMLANGADVTAANLVVTDNAATSGGGGVHVDSSTWTQSYSDVWGNTPSEFDGVSDPTGTAGNVSVDPELLDTAAADATLWDLHLSATSPAVDTGDPAIQDPDGSRADMGCYSGSGGGQLDLDLDGYPEWWQPGPYDHGAYPAQELDCNDRDPGITPDGRC